MKGYIHESGKLKVLSRHNTIDILGRSKLLDQHIEGSARIFIVADILHVRTVRIFDFTKVKALIAIGGYKL